MPEILLHQWQISPFCAKVRAVLEHKGLEYSVRGYNGLLALRAKGLSSAGKLPVLDYDGERITDSSMIAAFLEQRHPDPPLWPEDPVVRAQARLWEDWADESLYWLEIYFRFNDPAAARATAALLTEGRPGFETLLMGQIAPRMYGRKLQAHGLGRMAREDVEAKLFGHLDDLEAVLESQSWLVGSRRTLADIAAAAQIREIMRTSPLRPRMEERRAVGEWLARTLPNP